MAEGGTEKLTSGEGVSTPICGEGGGTTTPTCVVVLGMAGSGKTTFVQRLASDLYKGQVR